VKIYKKQLMIIVQIFIFKELIQFFLHKKILKNLLFVFVPQNLMKKIFGVEDGELFGELFMV